MGWTAGAELFSELSRQFGHYFLKTEEGVNLVFLTAKGRRFIQSALELQPRVSQFKIQIPLDAPFCSARWRGEGDGDDVWSLVIGEGGTVENHDFSSRHRPDGLTGCPTSCRPLFPFFTEPSIEGATLIPAKVELSARATSARNQASHRCGEARIGVITNINSH